MSMIQNKIISIFLHQLERLEHGSLRLVTPEGKEYHFVGKHAGVDAEMILHDWVVILNAARRGDIGLGEDYAEGLWESRDIGHLIELFLRNMDVFDSFAHGNMLNRLAFRMINLMRMNRRSQSKRNIKAHYDVGNDFYQLWLDETMTYSSALYADGVTDLAAAQRAKYNRILDKIQHHYDHANVLEIGCGWGGFAETAAHAYHHVTALTISPSQYDFAKKRLERQGLSNRAMPHLRDYRDERGTFDAIVSIEMFEAVGERYWKTYFDTIRNRLSTEGTAIIQTITIDDAIFPDYRTRSDYIRQYTFPGGMLPSVARFKEDATKAGLQCKEIFAFGLDYARTLRDWLARFDANNDAIRAMGYSDSFMRSWRFYLGMCIGAFCAERTNVVQVELGHA
ncbi:MAG: class I SAM-dependent methyltransferase [Alphaproteobacteria bacterium]|nr:MAG: class I SAM-dependent methyltransferase [Alphaproteobacteria bacterium]TAF75478.1 MAG: class I SAM-dependent methyltransferase [Alphaproteobacteria bacterium]